MTDKNKDTSKSCGGSESKIYYVKPKVFEDIKLKWFYKYDIKKTRNKAYNHNKIVTGNNEGLSPEGKEKLIDFFMKYDSSFRKICSFIVLQQKLNDKFLVIEPSQLCRFSGTKPEDLDWKLYFLWKTIQLIRTKKNTYRLPRYIWDSDVLPIVKKKQLEKLK